MHNPLTLDMDAISNGMIFRPSELCTVSCGTVCVDPRADKVLILYNRRLSIWQLPKGRKNIGEELHHAALRETYEETGVRATLLPLKVRTRCTMAGAAGAAGVAAPLHRATPSSASASSLVSTALSVSATSTVSSTATIASTQTTASSTPTSQTEEPMMPTTSAETKPGEGPAREGPCTCRKVADDDSVAGAASDTKITRDVFNNEFVGIMQYPDLQVSTPNTMKIVFFFAALADSAAPLGPGAQEAHEDLQAEWVDFSVADERLRFEPEKEAMWKVKRDMSRSGFCC